MELDVNDILARYAAEVAQLTQRAVMAEARAEAANKKLAEIMGQAEKNEDEEV